MQRFTVALGASAAADVRQVGGKGAGLVALAAIPGVDVPAGFCVTSAAFDAVTAALPGFDAALERLADPEARLDAAQELRAALLDAPLPVALIEDITAALATLGAEVAVRSSATAEDLPGASFAGQHDSFLGERGVEAVLDHVRRVWSSLFSDRAVAYRARQGFDHRRVHMAVVVQALVPAEAAGVLFTADPRSGNRRVSVVEAVRGLGEALVSGHQTPEHVEVRDGRVRVRRGEGAPVLDDAVLTELERLGRRIEAHLGAPQDVEWCWSEGRFWVVQARPITTLFPVPDAGDTRPRVFLSVGHQQMMTDPLRPLGLSVFQRIAGRPMFAAAGRLFVDPTEDLATPGRGPALLGMLSRAEPLTGDALRSLLDRGDFFAAPVATAPAAPTAAAPMTPPVAPAAPAPPDATVATALIAESEAAITAAAEALAGREGLVLLDAIDADLAALRQRNADPRSFAVIMAAANAANWLNDQIYAWLGERGVADALSRSLPDNVGAELGLALLDVADVIRPHPAVVAYLEQASDDTFFEGLDTLDGGPAVSAALRTFLDRFGVRCPGEIDVTRPRWRETPTALVPVLLSHVRAYEPGEAARRFEAGRCHAEATRESLLTRLRALPDGEAKAAEADTMITRLRALTGYREYPKYAIVRRFALLRTALRAEAERLTRAGVLATPEDLDFLRLDELRTVVTEGVVETTRIAARRAEHARDAALTPPRVITSEGEEIHGAYRRTDAPVGALLGLAVSAGVVEGRARVLHTLDEGTLSPGDILVTRFTDPGWTAVFTAVRGLVTEVGGLMTHGAVIAREYGLPAVVGVVDATRRIADGQRIRVDGTSGTVELLD